MWVTFPNRFPRAQGVQLSANLKNATGRHTAVESEFADRSLSHIFQFREIATVQVHSILHLTRDDRRSRARENQEPGTES